MNVFGRTNTSTLSKGLVLFLSLALGLICAAAFGHEWTVDGKKVKAKPVDFNGTEVLLEDEKGKRKSIEINTLTAEDLQYLTNLLTIRNAGIQQKLERQQLQQQKAQLMSQFVDVWTVRLVAPNGETGWKNYFALDSRQAKQLAFNEFPNARVISVQRLRRAGSSAAVTNGTGNIGVVPVVNRFMALPVANAGVRN
ncbi:MAG: hypothetical protein AB8B55_24775 [Mariniblastus sp.]